MQFEEMYEQKRKEVNKAAEKFEKQLKAAKKSGSKANTDKVTSSHDIFKQACQATAQRLTPIHAGHQCKQGQSESQLTRPACGCLQVVKNAKQTQARKANKAGGYADDDAKPAEEPKRWSDYTVSSGCAPCAEHVQTAGRASW